MAVSKKLKAIYNGFFDGIETFAANTIQIIQEERDLRRYIDKSSKLTAEQKKSVKNFWGGYTEYLLNGLCIIQQRIVSLIQDTFQTHSIIQRLTSTSTLVN